MIPLYGSKVFAGCAIEPPVLFGCPIDEFVHAVFFQVARFVDHRFYWATWGRKRHSGVRLEIFYHCWLANRPRNEVAPRDGIEVALKAHITPSNHLIASSTPTAPKASTIAPQKTRADQIADSLTQPSGPSFTGVGERLEEMKFISIPLLNKRAAVANP